MTLPNITLDDRNFDQLFAFMRKQIGAAHTDHNYSDPGIAMLDLLCWISEGIIFRTDRVPDAHIEKFADLILDPPEPVTIPLVLRASLDPARTAPLTVKAGTRFATVFARLDATGPARRFVFETLTPVTFQPQPAAQSVAVTAREHLMVSQQTLGISNGRPNQVFALSPVHGDIGLPIGVPAPVLLDLARTGEGYNPNPRVSVDGQPWQLKQSLLTEASWVRNNPEAIHFAVDANAGTIRFGDGQFGLVPREGASIVCSYQVLQGPAALRPPPGNLHRLDAIADLQPGEKIDVERGEPEGAAFFFPPDARLREGLKRFRRPYRLITADDFEHVMLNDFNDYLNGYQDGTAPGGTGTAEKVLRATALMNYQPQARQQQSFGCVTLLVLAQKGKDLDSALTDPDLPDQQKADLIALRPGLADKVQRFLDKRRLIGTRIFVQAPALTLLTIRIQVAVFGDRNTEDMERIVVKTIRAFLGVLTGGVDGRGWPMSPTGGGVYRSKLYRLLEDIEGVDHVADLSLTPANESGDVLLPPLSLPALARDGLAVNVVRV
ncbi:hypothetical protein [Bradyrhizobium sp. HKCCYLS20291]|uniref:hypothetical protein n=1 Tax=Bradyrhizobium sp. HKCCYLS20291 TaxID=3420766 RepID=UPI003EC02EC0